METLSNRSEVKSSIKKEDIGWLERATSEKAVE